MKKLRTYPISLDESTKLRSWHAVPTKEFRRPKRGEWYLDSVEEMKTPDSAIGEAHKAPSDLSTPYRIAVLVPPHAPVEADRLNLTLSSTLVSLGMTFKPHSKTGYQKAIRDDANNVTFIGDANDTWQWLRDTGRIC